MGESASSSNPAVATVLVVVLVVLSGLCAVVIPDPPCPAGQSRVSGWAGLQRVTLRVPDAP